MAVQAARLRAQQETEQLRQQRDARLADAEIVSCTTTVTLMVTSEAWA